MADAEAHVVLQWLDGLVHQVDRVRTLDAAIEALTLAQNAKHVDGGRFSDLLRTFGTEPAALSAFLSSIGLRNVYCH